MEILNGIKDDIQLSTDLIQLGLIDYLSVAAIEYEAHDYLSGIIEPYIKIILVNGSIIAIQEIKRESTYLRLCQKCQEVVERERMIQTGNFDYKVIKPIDRVNRLLMFMSNYTTREDVQHAVLDAIVTFTRNGDLKLFFYNIDFIPLFYQHS